MRSHSAIASRSRRSAWVRRPSARSRRATLRPTGPYCHVITLAKGASSSQSPVAVVTLARDVCRDDEECDRRVGDALGHGAAGLLVLAQAALNQADARE